LPDVLDTELVAELCDESVEWVQAMAFRLPCELRWSDGRVTVRREDLPAWLEAARPRRQQRATNWTDDDELTFREITSRSRFFEVSR
jgi:hypothetical protein